MAERVSVTKLRTSYSLIADLRASKVSFSSRSLLQAQPCMTTSFAEERPCVWLRQMPKTKPAFDAIVPCQSKKESVTVSLIYIL